LADLKPLVLGSGSPRRLSLLREQGISFRQVIPQIEESPRDGEDPYKYAERLACEKAVAVAAMVNSSEVVLGCDTIVVLRGEILGKPSDEEDAFAILSRLVGNEHSVCTALALVSDGKLIASGYELTRVFFKPAPPERIRRYITTREPMDKAGAYGIQGMGGFLVDRIEGNLDNVIGLPGKLLDELAGQVLKNL
jgi:septum formation protein